MAKSPRQYSGPCPNCGQEQGYKSNGSRGGQKWQFVCVSCAKNFTVILEDRVESPENAGIPGSPGLEDNGNDGTLLSDPIRDPATIPSLASVIKQFNVDLSVWLVEKHKINRYEMGYKDAKGDPGHYPLYQVHANLVRKIPVKCEWPIVAGATVTPWKPKAVAVLKKIKRRIILPDMQVGFRRDFDTGKLEPLHDVAACDVAASVIKDMQPDGIDLLGDNLDLPDWTDKYVKSPEFYWTTQPSIDWLGSFLGTIRKHAGSGAGPGEFRYLEGNHEARLVRAIINNMIAAYRLRPANEPDSDPLLSIPYWLGLRDMGIEWFDGYPKNKFWINDNLRVTHAEKLASKSGMSVSKSLDSARCSLIFGHAHRMESAHVTVHARDKIKVYGAYCMGTLARIDGIVPSNASEENWQQGFGIVDYEDIGRNDFTVRQVNIYNGRCLVDGRVYEAETDTIGECNG